MKEFNQKEIEFLESLEEARIATSHKNIPHVKPVSFVLEDNAIIMKHASFHCFLSSNQATMAKQKEERLVAQEHLLDW